jgi:hypothetical protein
MCLHDLQELMYNLADVFPESCAVLEGINSFQYFNIEFDLFIWHSIGANSQQHGNNYVQVVAQDGDVKLSYRINRFYSDMDVLLATLLYQGKHFWKQKEHICGQKFLATNVK